MSKLTVRVLDEANDYRTEEEKEEADRRAWKSSGSYQIAGIEYEDRKKPISFWKMMFMGRPG